MRRAAIIVPLLLLSCAAMSAAPDIGGTVPERVVFVGPAAPVAVYAGRSGKALLEFRVGPTYHINSNTPRSELLIPTTLMLTPPAELSVGKVTYPAGLDANFPFAPTETLNVYSGRFMVSTTVTASPKTVPGTYKMHGVLRYQACDDRACYPPKQLPVEFDVTVKKSTIVDSPKPRK